MVNMTPHKAYDKCYDEGKRMSELENIIITDPFYSYRYARNIINGRFIEGEKIISTDPFYSYYYARCVIKDSFHLGHTVIFNSYFKDDYIQFLKLINYDLSEIGEWLI